MLARLCPFICCPLLSMTCAALFLRKQLLNLFTPSFSKDNEQHCVMSCEQKPKEPTAERKASCVAGSELNFQASRQDSCTRLEDLQPQPRGASEERLMHGYRCLTWEMKQEGAQRGDRCLYAGTATLWSTRPENKPCSLSEALAGKSYNIAVAEDHTELLFVAAAS